MLEVFTDIEQGSERWRQVRLGIVTASEFHTVLASGRGGGESLTRRKYLYSLAGEIITGVPAESFSNGHMDRGREMEAEARDLYAFMRDAELQRVGFIRNGQKGCSPDSLIGANGMVEFKSALPHILIEMLLQPADWFPPQHKAQVQGGLWVAERDYVDLCVHWKGLPPFIRRAHLDAIYVRQLADAVEIFNAELHGVVEKVRRQCR